MVTVSRPARRAGDPADVDLLSQMRAGDRRAVDDLYDRYGRLAFTLARRVLGEDTPAEDVVQEVFLGVWRDPGAHDRDRGTVSAWLIALVHHEAVDAVRREESLRRRRDRAGEDLARAAAAHDGEEDVWARVVSDRVRSALGGLPAAQREALTLACYGGYTQREVAALTGAPLDTVKTRMLAGMRRLREELGGATLGGALGGGARVEGSSR
ncbi:sigma-70 family RNA polymerase sigma factor [Geodermatophilus sp. SYSU D00703]